MMLPRGAGILLVAVLASACAHRKPEGDRPWVRRLVLHGVRHVDEGDLRRHLVTEETAHVVWAPKQPFDPFALRLDTATVESYYHARGFFDARVIATDVTPADRPHAVNVEIFVDEGAPTRIEKVKVEGLDVIGDDAKPVFRNLDLRRGQIFDYARYEAEKGEMGQRLRTLGYAWAAIDGDVVVDRDRDGADVTLKIVEGPANLWRLGVGVTLELQRTEIRGRAEYTRYHWLGGLRRLRLRAEPAYVFVPAFWNPLRSGPAGTVEAEMTQLDLGLPPDELHVVAGYDLGVEYAFQYHGPRAAIGYSRNFFHDRLQVSVGYDFQYILFFGVDPAFTVDPALSAREYGYVDPYRIAWLEQALTLDLRDQPLETRRGGWFSLRGEEGGIWSGGDFDYEKIVAEVRGYYTLWRRLTVAARTEFGQAWSQGTNGTPTTRRFYLGGPETHRGFNFNRLSLQVPSGIAGNPALPVGGDEMFLTSIELRVRAVRLY